MIKTQLSVYDLFFYLFGPFRPWATLERWQTSRAWLLLVQKEAFLGRHSDQKYDCWSNMESLHYPLILSSMLVVHHYHKMIICVRDNQTWRRKLKNEEKWPKNGIFCATNAIYHFFANSNIWTCPMPTTPHSQPLKIASSFLPDKYDTI